MGDDDITEKGAKEQCLREAELAGNLFKYAVHAGAYQVCYIEP